MISHRGTTGRSGRLLGALAFLALIPAVGLTIALDAPSRSDLPGMVVNACLAMMGAAWDLTQRHLSAHPLTTLAIFFVAGSFLWAVLRTIASVVKTCQLLARSEKYASGYCVKLDAVLAQQEFHRLRLRLLNSTKPLAFTVGFWRPWIILSEGMVSTLSEEELAAVLSHELCHVQGRDPLRLAVVRFLVDALWFLPVARSLARDFADAVETAADTFAVTLTRQPVDLASALVKTARAGVQQAIPLATPLAGHLTVEDRVERLLGMGKRNRSETTMRRWVASGFITLLLFSLLILPPAGGHSALQEGMEQVVVGMPMMACHVSKR